ncbi:Enp1p [Sugiyamaella lignohabitans]|uniref:Enp1p n=1 Tax=Sugiyamaella lignohabitans TaxID=796027 RepID=A0A167DIQ7_9ASCO|nr:Enp1p [Sugiyamaella lignohabitans]ANB12960.1 Enp1p [Sugiyamaella lignohabitans]
MPKAIKQDQKLRHDPLHMELAQEGGVLRSQTKSKAGRAKKVGEDSEDKAEGFVGASLSRKILQIAKEQQDEIEQEENQGSARNRSSANFGFDDEDITGRFGNDDEESDDEDYEDYEEIEEIEIDPEEDALFNKYIAPVDGEENEDGTVVLNLADRIMEKIREKEMMEAAANGKMSNSRGDDSGEPEGVMLPPKVIEVYTRVGELLARYRSGKLPKAFKIIPSLRNWQDILYVTNPAAWSTQAVYEATKLFVSNLKANQSQKFITNILLERFRDDIQANKTLNYHVYRALKKALYKPAAFFKGFLFPLCESGTCTLKEAVIAGSILSKVSVPALHSAAALLRLADMEYSGPNSLFIKILLDKKYALPYKVVDGVVFHFIQFRAVESQLPVVWHQSLLVFAQRYKNDITEDQRDSIMAVLKIHNHSSITPEIRRELLSGATRQLATGQMDLN